MRRGGGGGGRAPVIFVGNLPDDVREYELDDLLRRYGRIRDIDLKGRNGAPIFAFVEFEDFRDADDAVYYLDGYRFGGYRLRVEFAKGDPSRERDRDRDRERGGRRREERSQRGPRGTPHKILVLNLPEKTSWQDLKDFCRSAHQPAVADVEKDHPNGAFGVVSFNTAEEMREAISKLDGEMLKSPYGETEVRVVEDTGNGPPSLDSLPPPTRGGGGVGDGGSGGAADDGQGEERKRGDDNTGDDDDDGSGREAPPPADAGGDAIGTEEPNGNEE